MALEQSGKPTQVFEISLKICTNAGGGVISGQYQICSKTKKISGCDKEAEIREDQRKKDVYTSWGTPVEDGWLVMLGWVEVVYGQ